VVLSDTHIYFYLHSMIKHVYFAIFCYSNRHNLANNTGLGGRGGKQLTMDIRNCNLWSQGTRTEKIGVTQSLIYIHPIPPIPPQFLYLLLFNSAANTILSQWLQSCMGIKMLVVM
jgi:hypothetical protein